MTTKTQTNPTNGIIHENGRTYMLCGSQKIEINYIKKGDKDGDKNNDRNR